MATEGEWSLKLVSDVVKNACVGLAERDGKDPFALTTDGKREIWEVYIPEMERFLIKLEAVFMPLGGLPKPRKLIEIDA